MSATKWVRSSLRHLQKHVRLQGYQASLGTLGRLLRKAKYSLKANAKREAGAAHPDRDRPFRYLAKQKQAFLKAGLPVISVDTKKKELIGNFKNAGRVWCQEAERVHIHDFAEDDTVRAVPYGLYDLTHNRGVVRVGTSADTPAFAVEAIAAWWQTEGQKSYPAAKQLLILADAGGSNGCHPRAWKQQVQEQLSDRFGLEITVCHYPAGCSKWNPVEYRLFSPISINWAGKPLRSLDILLSCIRATTTEAGLSVKAFLVDKVYKTGISVSDAEMNALRMHRHEVCPRWNYTFLPRPAEG